MRKKIISIALVGIMAIAMMIPSFAVDEFTALGKKVDETTGAEVTETKNVVPYVVLDNEESNDEYQELSDDAYEEPVASESLDQNLAEEQEKTSDKDVVNVSGDTVLDGSDYILDDIEPDEIVYDMDDFEGPEDFREALLATIDPADQYAYGIATYSNYNTGLVWASCDRAYLDLLDECREEMKERNPKIIVTYHTDEESVTSSQASSFAKTVSSDVLLHTGNPEEGDYLYWNMRSHSSSGKVAENKDGGTDITVTLSYTWRSTVEEEKEVSDKIDSIFASFGWKSNASDYEKVYDIYKYICDNVVYDNDNLANEKATGEKYYPMRTAYGVLVNGTGVCHGIGVTVYRMMLEAGIDCRCIYGDTNVGDHLWNIVEIDGLYYNVDATWDLGCKPARYTNFLKCDGKFSSHVRFSGYDSDDFYKTYPMSSSNYDIPSPTVKKDSDGKWYYYNEYGEKDTSYTGFAENENGKWYLEKGVVTFNKNSVIKDTDGAIGTKGDWWYVVGSKVQTGFTGLANYKNENGWWYISNGKVNFNAKGVYKNNNGWWYVTGGKVDFSYNGFSENSNGKWYCESGKVTFNKNSVIKDTNGTIGTKGNWWYVVGSKVQTDYTKKIANYKNEYGWWYIKSGKVDFSFTGIASNNNGTWYVKSGKVDFSYSGTVKYNGRSYKVKGGKVA